MHLSNYLENKLIDWIFRGIPFTPPNTYLALCTATPTDSQTGATIPEVVNGTYSRQQLIQGAGFWSAPTTDGKTSSAFVAITWRGTSPDAQDWGTITSIAIVDQPGNGAGNLLWYADLVTPVRVQPYDHITIPVGKISFQIDS